MGVILIIGSYFLFKWIAYETLDDSSSGIDCDLSPIESAPRSKASIIMPYVIGVIAAAFMGYLYYS